jgi:MFS family permease
LHITGHLQVWHLYVTAAIAGAFQGFQWPAYSAAISMMLPKEQYARANGMLELAGNASSVLAPILAGALIGPLGLTGILIVDLISASAAVGTLLFAHIPQPDIREKEDTESRLLKQMSFGFRYILARPSLLGLQTVFLVGNFFSSMAFAVVAPMILARTGNDELIFGSVQSVGAIGGVIGGLAMSAWGGPKRRVHGVLLGWFCSGLFGLTILGLGQAFSVWAVGMFVLAFASPFINGSNQAIWQAKVAPDVQGRVFSARVFIAWLVMPVAQLIAGPLADRVLEPAMAKGGVLAHSLGWIVGTGDGAGIALLFVSAGVLASLAGLSGYLIPAICDAELILPDHDATIAQT